MNAVEALLEEGFQVAVEILQTVFATVPEDILRQELHPLIVTTLDSQMRVYRKSHTDVASILQLQGGQMRECDDVDFLTLEPIPDSLKVILSQGDLSVCYNAESLYQVFVKNPTKELRQPSNRMLPLREFEIDDTHLEQIFAVARPEKNFAQQKANGYRFGSKSKNRSDNSLFDNDELEYHDAQIDSWLDPSDILHATVAITNLRFLWNQISAMVNQLPNFPTNDNLTAFVTASGRVISGDFQLFASLFFITFFHDIIETEFRKLNARHSTRQLLRIAVNLLYAFVTVVIAQRNLL